MAGKYPHEAAALTRPSILGVSLLADTASASSSALPDRGAAQLSCDGISGIFGSSGRCDMAACTRTCVVGLHVLASLRRDSRLASLLPWSFPVSSVSCVSPSSPAPRALLQDTVSRTRATIPLVVPSAAGAEALHVAAALTRAR